jgi:hypothetical protein
MLRIVRFETRRDLKAEDIAKLFSRAHAVAAEIKKVRGIAWCKFFFNGLEIILVAEGEGYGAADRVDVSKIVKEGVSQMFTEFGYAPTKDEFLRDPLEYYGARRGKPRRSRPGGGRKRRSRSTRRGA